MPRSEINNFIRKNAFFSSFFWTKYNKFSKWCNFSFKITSRGSSLPLLLFFHETLQSGLNIMLYWLSKWLFIDQLSRLIFSECVLENQCISLWMGIKMCMKGYWFWIDLGCVFSYFFHQYYRLGIPKTTDYNNHWHKNVLISQVMANVRLSTIVHAFRHSDIA